MARSVAIKLLIAISLYLALEPLISPIDSTQLQRHLFSREAQGLQQKQQHSKTTINNSDDNIQEDLESLLKSKRQINNGKIDSEGPAGRRAAKRTQNSAANKRNRLQGLLGASSASEASKQQPPNELVFSNQTGAIVQCGIAIELARNIHRVELQSIHHKSNQAHSQPELGSATVAASDNQKLRAKQLFHHQQTSQLANLFRLYEIQIRWEKENGDEIEPTTYAPGNQVSLASSGADSSPDGLLKSNSKPLRFVRPSDGALVFEPFRAGDFRPEIHATTYRCHASSSTKGASLISRDMHVKAFTMQPTNEFLNQISVLDEMVLDGNSAVFRCSIPMAAQDYLQVLDWFEYPSELQLSYQSTTLNNLRQQLGHSPSPAERNASDQANNVAANSSLLARYFVAPKTGDLHILNVDLSLHSRQYKCRCKNKLTGEIISSVNRGKLIVSESATLIAPKLLQDHSKQLIFNENELALLSCNLQSYPRSQISWFKRRRKHSSFANGNNNANHAGDDSEFLNSDLVPIKQSDTSGYNQQQPQKYIQLANLLFINRLTRNDSGVYVCQIKNSISEERLELELSIRAPLRVKLSASANVLELGKSLALECSVTGFPIHQVVFRHNQNIIKSISGQAAGGSLESSLPATNRRLHHHQHHYSNQHRSSSGDRRKFGAGASSTKSGADAGSYFVVDNGAGELTADYGPQKYPAGLFESSTLPSSEPDPAVTSILDDNSIIDNVDYHNAVDYSYDDEPAANAGELDFEKEDEIKLSHVIVVVLEPQHAGSYQCFAYNQYESVQSNAYIKVLDDPPKFKTKFKEELYEMKQDISLQCSAKANPLPEINWFLDGQPLSDSSRVKIGDFVTKDNLLVSYVNISQTQVIDAGLYQCTADNGLASISHQAQINVMGPIQIKPMPNVTLVAATTFKQRCLVAGYPVQEIQWQHNGRRLPANHRQHVYENGTLEVEHVEKSQGDEGEYVCLASGPAGAGSGEPNGNKVVFGSVYVSIKVRPTIEPFAISRSLREGQRATIMCTISSGDLPISISWFRNGQPLAESPSITPQVFQQQPSHDFYGNNNNNDNSAGPPLITLANVKISRPSDYSSTLMFESLLVEHSGNYTCSARNDAGSVSHQAPMIVQVAPRWSIEPSDTNIVRGLASSIDCMATGFPPPRIIWTKAASNTLDSKQSQDSTTSNQFKAHHLGSWRSIVSSPHLQVYENGSLNILDARDSDFGHYMCQATNGVGPGLSKVIKVTINVAAQFNTKHSIQYVTKGEQAQLKCLAKGDWPLIVHWFKGKNRLEPINIQDGPASSVQQQPQQIAPAASISASQQSVSSVLASVLLLPSSFFPSSLATNLNSNKKGSQSVMEQLNSLLLASSLQSSGNNLKSQQQQQQQQGGLLMQKYSLAITEFALRDQASSASSSSSPGSHPMATLERQRASLGANTNDVYLVPVLGQINSILTINQVDRQDTGTFKCLAANHFGFDERTIQLIVQELPERVEELTTIEVHSRSVTLSWLAPFDGNTPIMNYHIQYRAAGSLQQALVHQQQQLLSSNQMSSESLSALNWSNHTISMLPSANINDQLVVASDISNALVSRDASSLMRNPLKVSINSLKPMTKYWFRVSAENKLGFGPVSSVLEVPTKEEMPGSAPQKFKATAQSSSSILVSWTKINEKESFGSVAGYHVAYREIESNSSASSSISINDQASQSIGSNDNNQPLATNLNNINTYKTIANDDKLSKFDALLTGLKRSTRYSIAVQAYNAMGTGPATEPVIIRTLEMDPPKQVKLFVKQATNCSIQLEWRPLSQAALQQQQHFGKLGNNDSIGRQQQSSIPTPMSLFMNNLDSISAASSSSSTLPPPQDSSTRQQQLLWESADVVDYYLLYQAELNDQLRWQELRLPGHSNKYVIDNLNCGTRYQFYMMGVNKIGVGDQSDILDSKTAGGLPLAPNRQMAFDVINTTCYVIRLDHWQDNGCPIREFNVRYRLDSVGASWTRLAHFNLDDPSGSVPSELGARVRASQTVKLNYMDKSDRFRRSLTSNFPIDISGSDDDDAFLDYSFDSANSATDYLTDSISFNGSALVSDQPESSQLLSLLKDSMIPSLESSELIESKLSNNFKFSDLKKSPDLPAVAQEWQASNFVENLQQQQSTSQDGKLPIVMKSTSQQANDWHRVRLCNLNENVYYIVQMTTSNSVGETEAELKILTSQEGLEYNQEFKRQVVGDLNARNRLAQSSAISDRLNFLGFSQWSALLPITLTITLMTIIIIMALLFKKTSNSSKSTTMTTTTTTSAGLAGLSALSQAGTTTTSSSSANNTSSSSASHCQNYLNESHANHLHHQHLNLNKYKSSGAASAITEAATIGSDNLTMVGNDRYQMMANDLVESAMILDSNNYNLYQHQAAGNNLDPEPAYGIVGLVNNDVMNLQDNESPLSSNCINNNQSVSNIYNQQDLSQRGRSVYLCSKDEPKSGDAIFYNLNGNTADLYSQHYHHQAGQQNVQQQDLYAGPTTAPIDIGDGGSSKQLDDRFLSIVEEVARANDNLNQRGASQVGKQDKNQQSIDQVASTMAAISSQCNQLDCFHNNQTQFNEQTQQAANRLMFDPVYATIRRTFPQAFRYLTLQQNHNQHNNNNQANYHNTLQRLSNSNQQQQPPPMFCPSQRHSLNDESTSNNASQQQQQQQFIQAHDMTLFNSANLAALNLLTSSNQMTTDSSQT